MRLEDGVFLKTARDQVRWCISKDSERSGQMAYF